MPLLLGLEDICLGLENKALNFKQIKRKQRRREGKNQHAFSSPLGFEMKRMEGDPGIWVGSQG
jgi:hypothetical protein